MHPKNLFCDARVDRLSYVTPCTKSPIYLQRALHIGRIKKPYIFAMCRALFQIRGALFGSFQKRNSQICKRALHIGHRSFPSPLSLPLSPSLSPSLSVSLSLSLCLILLFPVLFSCAFVCDLPLFLSLSLSLSHTHIHAHIY